jgi:hypothetical protein
MVIRACLVALDWNYNVDRAQKQSATGQLQYRKKVRIADLAGFSFDLILRQSQF